MEVPPNHPCQCISAGFSYPQNNDLGGWGFPFCGGKSGLRGPRPLQNEEPATNVARCFLYKIRAPKPLFLGAPSRFVRTNGLYKVGNLE